MTDSSARRSLVDLDQVIDLSAERPDAQPTPTMPVGGTRLALALVAGSLAVAGVVTMARAWTDDPPTADTIVDADEPPTAAPTRAMIPLDDRADAPQTRDLGSFAHHDAAPQTEPTESPSATPRRRARRRQRDTVIAAATLHDLPRLEPDEPTVPRAQPQPDAAPEGESAAVATRDAARPEFTGPDVAEPSATGSQIVDATRTPADRSAPPADVDAGETTPVGGQPQSPRATDEVPVARAEPAPSAVAVEAALGDDGDETACLACDQTPDIGRR